MLRDAAMGFEHFGRPTSPTANLSHSPPSPTSLAKRGSTSVPMLWLRECRTTACLSADGGTGATAYAEAVGVYLALAVDQ